MDMRYEDDEEGNPFYFLLLAPSFSPEFGNNPGYTSLLVEGETVHNVFFNFIDISSDDPSISNFAPEFDLGILDLYTPQGTKRLFQYIQSETEQFNKWNERRMGFCNFESTQGATLVANMKIENPQAPNSKYMCFNSHMLTADYNNCIGNSATSL